jgi:hypothetical protein
MFFSVIQTYKVGIISTFFLLILFSCSESKTDNQNAVSNQRHADTSNHGIMDIPKNISSTHHGDSLRLAVKMCKSVRKNYKTILDKQEPAVIDIQTSPLLLKIPAYSTTEVKKPDLLLQNNKLLRLNLENNFEAINKQLVPFTFKNNDLFININDMAYVSKPFKIKNDKYNLSIEINEYTIDSIEDIGYKDANLSIYAYKNNQLIGKIDYKAYPNPRFRLVTKNNRNFILIDNGYEACGYSQTELLLEITETGIQKICELAPAFDGGMYSLYYKYYLPGEIKGLNNEVVIVEHIEQYEENTHKKDTCIYQNQNNQWQLVSDFKKE